MHFSRITGAVLATVVALLPVTASAAFYANGKDGLIFVKSDNRYCHIDSRTHAHCEDYIGKPLGSLYMSFGGRRPGCVVAFIEEEEYKPAQYRWHAKVFSDFAKSATESGKTITLSGFTEPRSNDHLKLVASHANAPSREPKYPNGNLAFPSAAGATPFSTVPGKPLG